MKLNNNTLLRYSSTSLFARYAIPGMIGTLMASAAILIDGMFIARFVNAEAFASINVVYPIGALAFGIYVMFTVGAIAVVGKYIGENKMRRANLIFTQTLIVVTLFGLLSISTIYLFKDIIQPILGAHGDILKYSNEYILPMLVASFFMGQAYTLTQFAKLDGSPKYASASFIVAAVLNIIFDTIFIAVLDLGVAGAGWATALSQFVAFIIMLLYFFSPKCKFKIIKIYGGWGYIKKAAINGFSEFINSVSTGLIPWLFNVTSFAIAGNAGILAYSVANYAFSFLVMIIYALSESIQPLISVSFGAKNKDKMVSFLRMGLISAILISLTTMFCLFIKPSILAGMLLRDVDVQTYKSAIFFLRAMVIGFVGIGINIVMSSYYTSVQCAGASVIVALFRSIILPVVLLIILPNIFGFMGLIIVIPLSEIFTLIMSILLYKDRKPSLLCSASRIYV